MSPAAKPARSPFWLLPNLLSLDAPLVAVAWQALLAKETGLPLRAAARAALALTVWGIYVADRLLDVRHPGAENESARHRFYRRHRSFAICLLAAIATADALLIAFDLRPAVLRSGFLAFGGVFAYLAVLHIRARTARLPKELLVALLFTAGTFLVAATNAVGRWPQLILPACAFFFLCFANLVAIEMWESRELRGLNSVPPHWTSTAFGRAYSVCVGVLMAACLCRAPSPWYRAIFLSAAFTLFIVTGGKRWPLDLRRVLVDTALMTPLLFLS